MSIVNRRRKILLALEGLVIIAVLVGRYVAHHATENTQAQQEALREQLRSFRSQIEVYKLKHDGHLPNEADHLAQLKLATHAASKTGGLHEMNISESNHYGSALPVNPVTHSNRVRIDRGAAGTAPKAAPDAGGWIYRPATGEVWADDTGKVDW